MSLAPLLDEIDAHYRGMPPVAAMDLRIARCDDDAGALHLTAPLARHVNDKGCAFGGSMASLMTLAGWGLVTLQLRAAGLEADVYVADSQARFLAPLYGDLDARACLVEGAAGRDTFLQTFRTRGRARVMVQAAVALPGGGVAADSQARYVAIARPAQVGCPADGNGDVR